MRSVTFKWIILLSTILIGLLVSAQLFWLSKIYNYDEKEFNTSVIKSIRGVYEDLELSDSAGPELQKLIEQPNVSTFLFRIDSIPPKDTLINTLLNNLEDFGVFTDCKMALYDDSLRAYTYTGYIPTAASKHPDSTGIDLPVYNYNYAYVQLFFRTGTNTF